ncbi:hypothetical protein [Saccharothrix syringae]|uniref:hypothetical protein n=1 Tax=Saccharothrix syringae TaxID=103733 RepID=UPI00068C8F57|nr:hypothetical protein [Saccharothrix syringae]
MYGFETVGVVRGERRLPLNDVLAFAVGCGMTLVHLDRAALAVHGCAEVVAEVEEDFDVICCACGIGGTLAGIAAAVADHRTAVGFSALKGGGFLFGGFAKRNAELDGFVSDFRQRHGIDLEWVYVAKMLGRALADQGAVVLSQDDAVLSREVLPPTRARVDVTAVPDSRATVSLIHVYRQRRALRTEGHLVIRAREHPVHGVDGFHYRADF